VAEDKKTGYPKIPRSAWFGLREKLKQRVPAEISPSYVAAALNMTPISARTNIMPTLSTFGLIDTANRPTERAFDWRDDSKYAEVCRQIIEEAYPAELRDVFHTPDASLDGVKAWFARSARVGDAAAGKFAATYLMLLEANPSGVTAAPKTKSANPGKAAKLPRAARAKQTPAVDKRDRGDQAPNADSGAGGSSGAGGGVVLAPKLHIDIQIHISPESSSDQIDKIFESMAKHLKDFRA
jgi:hypothetical protein